MANITKIFLDGTEYNVGTDTDTKVTQTNSTYNANYRLLMSNTADNTTRTEGAKKSANFYANPSTGAFYAKGYNRTDITGNTLDVNTLTLSAGNVMALFYIERTDGGANNITNIPVAGKPFMLDVELIRWASTTDYITRQLFRNANNPANEYVRFCTNGTWGSWTTRVFTDTHWTTHLYAGSGTAANAETTNGNTKITVADNSTVRNNVTIKGTGATTVTSDANGVITVNSTNTTYSAATQSASGLMTASDKTKLDGIATGAEVNQNAFSNVTVGSTTIAADGKTDTLTIVAGSNITLTPDATNDKLTIAATDTTYSAATQSAAGLMSAADKTKLDGIATGAEVNQNAFSNVVVGSTTIAADGKTDTLTLTAGSNVTLTPDATNDKVTIASTDTKNTAGSTDTSNKIFLVGATSQAANPQTYSHDTAYVGTDGCLYSGGTKVLTAHQDISGKVSKSGDTMTGRLTTTKAINQIITGSGTAASDKGSGVSPRYFPAKWTFNTGSNCTNGDIFTIKIPVAGHDYGVFMSVNNGTNYYPIVLNGTGRLTSHYPNGTYIQVVFESSASAASIFPLNGGDARETVTGGAFRVINYCNTDIRPSAYCDTAAATAAKTASCTNYNLLSKSYLHIVVVNANTSQTALTLNVNGKGAKPIYINGSASSASNYTLPAGTYLVYYNGTNYYFRTDGKITGDITGNAATVGGHTVAKDVPSDAKFTDTTYSAVSKTANGLCPQLPNETTTTKYLRQDGTWQVPPQSSYTLPTASASVLGGVKVGTNLSISNGVLSATDTKYTAGAGLSLNGTTFKTDVGALQERCNNLPDEDTFVVDEFAAGSNYNLPSNNIFHIISIRGGWNQNSHTTQLALGVTVRAAYFRNYMNGAWQGWQSIINTTYGTVSKTAAGLCPQLPNETTTTKFLRQDGTWQVPVGVTVDSALSSTSTNPVQNKVINSALAGKQATLAVVTDSGSQSGVYSWNAIKVGRMATVTFSGQTSVTLPADFKPAITVYGTTGKSISTDGVMQASSTTATYTYITAS